MVRKAAIGFLSFLLFCSLSVFGATFAMNRTILNPDFVIAQIDRMDVSSLVEEAAGGQFPLGQIPPDLEPWIREQTHTVIYGSYDYLLGKSERLSVVIDLEPVRESLEESMGVAGLIPPTIEINATMIRMMSPETMDMLEQARRYIGYEQLAYRISIGAMIGIIVGLVFLHRRRLKSSARSIGIPCLTCGIPAFVGTLLAGGFATMLLAQLPPSPQLQGWLMQSINDLLAPLRMYSIGLMVTGITLLVLSVVYKERRPPAETALG
ncbi:MAG: hypothetical protein JSU76_02480 [Dehalococcoidia bacterium]|nr:MAG: hypothetical protein JSU76_02480 [Dehalococcoidia bacterium]